MCIYMCVCVCGERERHMWLCLLKGEETHPFLSLLQICGEPPAVRSGHEHHGRGEFFQYL